MKKPTIEEMAKTLYDDGMRIKNYDIENASNKLEEKYVGQNLSEDFYKIAFDIFCQIMKIETSKMV